MIAFYELAFVLALTLVAVLAGASNFRQISDQIADFPRSLLAKLGAKWCYFRGDFARPSERTVRRKLEDVDADELDSAVGEWLRENARRDGDGVLALAIDGSAVAHNGTPGAGGRRPGRAAVGPAAATSG